MVTKLIIIGNIVAKFNAKTTPNIKVDRKNEATNEMMQQPYVNTVTTPKL